jgi:lipoprotein-releasing system permease protein
MPYELSIALRYLRSGRRRTFISFISIMSVAGVTVGVATLIVVLAVMDGFKKEIEEKLIGIGAHITVYGFGGGGIEDYPKLMAQIEESPHVVSSAPVLVSEGMVRFRGGRAEAVGLFGIDPYREARVSGLEGMIKLRPPEADGEGGGRSLERMLNLTLSDGSRRDGIILGSVLASNVGVSLGDEVVAASLRSPIPSKGSAPRVGRFRVGGIFESGYYEHDAKVAYISMEAATKLTGLKGATWIQVKVDDIYRTKMVSGDLYKRLGFSYWARSWQDMNRNLFSAIRLQRAVMFVILTFIIVVAAFGIATTLIMMVMEKTADIGILKSMGATSSSIRRIFLWEGLTISISGVCLGCVVGYVLSKLLGTYRLINIPGDIYNLNTLPVAVVPLDYLVISSVALVICIVASVYPSHQASRLDPIAAIKEKY